MADTTTTPRDSRDRNDDLRVTGALDVPTTDVDDLVRPAEGAYSERDDWRPDPLYQYGNLDTSDTAGAAHQSMAEVSPAFEAARAQQLVTAARALDPDDDGVSRDLVVLPDEGLTVAEARENIAAGIRRLNENPVQLGGAGPAQQAAAEEIDDSGDDRDGDGVSDNADGNRSDGVGDGGRPAAANESRTTATTAEGPGAKTSKERNVRTSTRTTT